MSVHITPFGKAKTYLEENGEVVEIKIKNGKAERVNPKKEIIGKAAAIGISAIVIGGILLHKRPVKTMQSEISALENTASEIQEQAPSILQSAKNRINEVTSIIQGGKNTNYETVSDEAGTVLKRFTTEISETGKKHSPSLLEEFSPEGVLLRRTEISQTGMPSVITTFEPARATGGFGEIRRNDVGGISVLKGIKVSKEGTTIGSEFNFSENGFLYSARSNAVKKGSEVTSAVNDFIFTTDGSGVCKKNCTRKISGGLSSELTAIISSGKTECAIQSGKEDGRIIKNIFIKGSDGGFENMGRVIPRKIKGLLDDFRHFI